MHNLSQGTEIFDFNTLTSITVELVVWRETVGVESKKKAKTYRLSYDLAFKVCLSRYSSHINWTAEEFCWLHQILQDIIAIFTILALC